MMIFVYGTLLKGMQRENVLARSEFHGPALLEAGLFDLGAFPGIKEGCGEVIGEMYRIDEETLTLLDTIEGYEPDQPENSLYLRRTARVRRLADGEPVEVMTYFYNHPVREEDAIPHGDYRRYLLEQQSSSQWVVAYGSNMCSARLEARVGKVDRAMAGHLEGYRLVFNKQACHGDSCYANAVWSSTHHRCPAVAWKLTTDQVEQLDHYEGAPRHYLRVTLPFRKNDGETRIVQVYLAHPDWIGHPQDPEPEYLAHIRRGYREHGFDDQVLYEYEEAAYDE